MQTPEITVETPPPSYTLWGGVHICPDDYSPSTAPFPYICPRSNYGYSPDLRLPRYGSVDLKPIIVGYNHRDDYVKGRGHSWAPYTPYSGDATGVQFETTKHTRPKKKGFWRKLFSDCLCR
ncbi:hypothetical protein H072_7559 [Dactylellina haptotyla CBS 200.50]|uniref:Uncharacterized protein n=1 Tax=Dactylellina haptotyla (strain CBS 200.50) TaxID=1284197 RepID=S8A6W3_DACHA|nr:hypothetical protein H072_7559 [Dactylellina haptotyla CBS 200.50]